MERSTIRRTQSYIVPKRKSSLAFRVYPSSDMDQRERMDSISSRDANLELRQRSEESLKRVSISLANVERMSRIKFDTIDQDERDSISKDSEEMIVPRERGSTMRSTVLLDPIVLGKFPTGPVARVHRMSTLHMRLSDNVPVRNMSFDPPPYDDLSTEEADNYADVIDKLLEQLELIRYTIPAKVNDKWNERFEDMEGKYDEKFDEFQMILNNGKALSLSAMEKLQGDRTYIHNVLKELSMELRSRRRYDCLEKEINNIIKIGEAHHDLEINYEIWKEQLAQLNDLIVDEKVDNEIQVNKLLASVHESGVRIENAIFLCSSRSGYVRKWEGARLDQQKLLLEQKEQILQDKLSECLKLEKADDIVSSELRIFLRGDITKIEEEIKIWSERYNKDIEQCQRDIDYFNERIKDVEETLEKNYKLRDERQEFIEKCENEKREKIKEAEYWRGIHSAATLIQSLWRGYMVRHQLGEYKRLWVKLKKRKKLAARRRRRKNRLKKKTKKIMSNKNK